MDKTQRIAVFLLIAFWSGLAYGWDLSHRINLLGSYSNTESNDTGAMLLEYYPSFKLPLFQQSNIGMDIFGEYELSERISWGTGATEKEFNAEFYRCWLRSTTEQSELRVGLQKINFGPAAYLRSLQWFDQLNPLDERQQTPGVWSALARYYLLDNSNFWFWGIYNKDEGVEEALIRSKPESIEPGGRLQLPILGGDCGVSYHTRQLEEQIDANWNSAGEEQRYGIDGRWDSFIGFWFESTLNVRKDVKIVAPRSEVYTLGADYTVGIGGGLHLLWETMFWHEGDEFWGQENRYGQYHILAADMPLGIYDKVLGVVAYDRQAEVWNWFFSYGLTYDYLSINFNLSINQERVYSGRETGVYNTGSSFQILLQLDY
ncbi:MAG: hypothetical protein K9N06_02540 [Candidatus Cloacimonetes bacterium]|nr:hypothetical protein [Candidatus Cloacimonadota bacterium]